MTRKIARLATFLLTTYGIAMAQQPMNPYLNLMQKAAAHAAAHHALKPALSPNDGTVLKGLVPVAALQKQGIQVVPWTTNDPEKMRAMIRLGATEGYVLDGLISDRPDLLQRVLAEERAASPESRKRLEHFNVSGHRGARGLRPENTLPAFEAGLDHLIDTIETDTGVTSDHVSLIWHDQFLNPLSCRRADGKPYTLDNRAYTRDLSMPEAQATFICDKLRFGGDQTNDLALSPVAVAFAAHERLISPYVPTYAEQLFRFADFYAAYYRTGPGKSHPDSQARAANAARVHFNLETKILPGVPPAPGAPTTDETAANHTVSPQVFVDTLCGAIRRHHLESRADVQSFDFRTLVLIEEQYPTIPTYYLTDSPESLATELVPATLR